MKYFVQIDENNIIINTVVADDATIAAGPDGDPSEWIETSQDNSFRKQYAGIGMSYDKVNDVFITKPPHASWVLDNNHDWQPPSGWPDDFIGLSPSGMEREQYVMNKDTGVLEKIVLVDHLPPI